MIRWTALETALEPPPLALALVTAKAVLAAVLVQSPPESVGHYLRA